MNIDWFCNNKIIKQQYAEKEQCTLSFKENKYVSFEERRYKD